MSKRKLFKYDSLFGFKDEVVPTRTVVPEWYKKIPRNVIIPGDSNTKSAKHCIPFLDSLTVGYSICLMTDLYIQRDEQGAPTLLFSEPEAGPNARHSIQTDPMPVPHGYEAYYWVWLTRQCNKKNSLEVLYYLLYNSIFTIKTVQPLKNFQVSVPLLLNKMKCLYEKSNKKSCPLKRK